MYSRKGIRKIGYHFQKMYRLYITYETHGKTGGEWVVRYSFVPASMGSVEFILNIGLLLVIGSF